MAIPLNLKFIILRDHKEEELIQFRIKVIWNGKQILARVTKTVTYYIPNKS